MGTKTIGVREDVYRDLAAEKGEDESFSDVIHRLLENERSDWRMSFGKHSGDSDLEEVVERQREDAAEGLDERQRRALDG